MSLATTFACFGCVDIANNRRTRAYVDWACRQGRFDGDRPQLFWMCDCEEDAEDIAYDNPIDDGVCWFDPLVPESSEFLGVIITRVGGLRSSSFDREVTDGIVSGSILSRPKIRGKELTFEAIIVASSCAGMDYGIEWLRRVLEDDGRCARGGTTCASCQGQMLTLRVHCPEPEHLDRGLRSFPTAGTIDGVDFVEDDYPMGRRNCCTMRRITWAMHTEGASSFSADEFASDEIDAASENVFQRLGSCPSVEPKFGCCPMCKVECDPCTTDPGCDCVPPFVLQPERVTSAADACFKEPKCRCIGAVSLDSVPAGYDAALRFTLFAGWDPSDEAFQEFGLVRTVLRIYENPEEFATPSDVGSYEAFTTRQLPCAEIGISWMPAGSQLILDGLTGRSWLLCNGACYDHSRRVTTLSGSLMPLIVRCVPIIATVEWDCISVVQNDVAPAIPSSLKLESYLRYRL